MPITPSHFARRDLNRLVAIPPADLTRGKRWIYVTPQGAKITGLRAWYPAGPLIAVEVLSVDGAGAAIRPQRFAHGPHFDPKHPTKEIVFADDDSLAGITGMLDAAGTAIVNIVLHTFDADPKAPAMQLGPDGGHTAYSFLRSDLPPKAEIVGLFLEMGPNGLRRIAPICEVPGPPNPVLYPLDGVRWLNYTEQKYPVPDLNTLQLAAEGYYVGTDIPPISTFLQPKLFRVVYELGVLTIYNETGKAHVLKFKHALEDEDSGDRQFLFVDEAKQEVRVKFPGATRGDIEWMLDGRRMRTVKPYDEIPETDPSFGHVFSQQNSTPFDNSPFGGWDATKIDPRDLQGNAPVGDYIFAYPDTNSHLYHKSDKGNQKIVPNGVLYNEDRISKGNTLTRMSSSESEVAQSWTATLGAKMGFGPFSFKASASFRGSVKNTLSRSTSSTLSTFTAQSHLLFVDMPRVELADEFVEEVKRLIHGTDVQYKNFVEAYGTHYAYATTFGARVCKEMTFTKAATVEALSAGVSISAEAGGGFDGVTLGANASASFDQSTKLGSEVSTQIEQISAVGGEATEHGVTLGASPVPIMLDLRPVADVLNAVFFTDERIYTDVRTRLGKAILDYGASVGDDFDTISHLPPILLINFKSIRQQEEEPHWPYTHPMAWDIRTWIQISFDLSGPAKSTGFEHHIGDRYDSTVWDQETSAVKLDPDHNEVPLGVQKTFVLDGAIPADCRFTFHPYDGEYARGDGWLRLDKFSRRVQTVKIDCIFFEYTMEYRLVGGDITWQASPSAGI